MMDVVAGRYRIVREIGRGGGGSVWLARDERLGRNVALKRMHSLPGESSRELERGIREARLAAALHHEHIVAVFDIVDEGEPLLVMEYVDGPSMATMIERDGWLPTHEVAMIGAQIASAMRRAHEAHIIHRDIKPANILVTEGPVAKLADFGIARAEGDQHLTAEGMTSGTALYFSPELAEGEEPSPMSDVWALGATLYYAVEGRPPIAEGATQLATLRRIATTAPEAPRNAGPLRNVLAAMLDANPRTRISMAEAEEALRAVAETGTGSSAETAVIGLPAAAYASTPDPVERRLPTQQATERVEWGSPAHEDTLPHPGGRAAAGAATTVWDQPSEPGWGEAEPAWDEPEPEYGATAGSDFGRERRERGRERRSPIVPILLVVLTLAVLAAVGLFALTTTRGGSPSAPVTSTTTRWHTQYVEPTR